MLYVLGGFALLGGFLMLVYLFVNADPARLARGLKVTGIVIAILAVAALAVSGRRRRAAVAARHARCRLDPGSQPSRPLPSAFRRPDLDGGDCLLAHDLDHDTGSMTGTVLRGRFSGMRVEELGSADLVALLRECRAEDEEGARLLEAYLDRVHPDWRDELAGERAGGSGSGARSTSGDMTVEEAYAILGLAPGADAEAIKEAHRRLMVKLHPDHGGSDYLATKINRARDVLLHH